MQTFDYRITDLLGIHARPVQRILQISEKFESHVFIESQDGKKEVNIKDVQDFIKMGIEHGDVVRVKVDGADEKVAAAAIKESFKENL